jgi:hypothetical protein
MKAMTFIMLFYMFVSVATVCMIALMINKSEPIPCGVSEISPDFSNVEREYCRKLRQRQSSSKHFL